MKRLIIGLIIGFMLASSMVYAYDRVVDFSEESLVQLNEMLRKILVDIDDHETRIAALE